LHAREILRRPQATDTASVLELHTRELPGDALHRPANDRSRKGL